MNNRHKPLHDLEDRGGGVPGKKASEGSKKMNDALRKAARPTFETDKAVSTLGDKSPGDKLREARKQQQLEALEKHRSGRQ